MKPAMLQFSNNMEFIKKFDLRESNQPEQVADSRQQTEVEDVQQGHAPCIEERKKVREMISRGVSRPHTNLLSEKDRTAAIAGIRWLLGLQNRDGGMPTFCQGWGMLPFDQSSTDITAHALRAFRAWKGKLTDDALSRKMQRAEERMCAFLERSQQKNGSWFPLWFGNQAMPDDVNPFYGTARVLLALTDIQKGSVMVLNGLQYLIGSQNVDGSWGNSVEETAVVVESLSQFADRAEVALAYHRGLNWLLEAVESDRFLETSPIGLYFAKLWYYEDLYPIIFTASALRRALLCRSTGEIV